MEPRDTTDASEEQVEQVVRATEEGEHNRLEYMEQLGRVEVLLAQWRAWRRKETTTRPPLTREYLEEWRAQLFTEQPEQELQYGEGRAA